MSSNGAQATLPHTGQDVLREAYQAARNGDTENLRRLCESRRKAGHRVPLQRVLKVAIEGTSSSVLEVLFSEGAEADCSIDTIPVNPAGRRLSFFRTLADHGWPKGHRGLSENLKHGQEVVRLLIQRGATIDVPCLKNSVRNGDSKVVDLLMSHIDHRTKIPTIYDYMKAMSDPDYWQAPEMHSEKSSLKRIVDEAGLLQIAAHYQHLDLIRYLLDKGANLDLIPDCEQGAEGVNGCALHKVVAGSSAGRIPRPDIVQALLDAGADVSLKDELGRTAFEINEDWGDQTTKEAIRNLLRAKMQAER